MDLCKDATTPQNMVSELLMNTYYRTSRLLFYYINLHRTVVNMPKFNPPDSFDFSHPVTWLPLEQRFARFRIATKLDKEDQIVQVSYLIYAMGTEAEQVIESFTFINDGDNEKFDPVMAKFDAPFVPKTKVIHERSTFNKCVQKASETVESFVRRLFELWTNCNYGDNRSDQIRDGLVLGLIDK